MVFIRVAVAAILCSVSTTYAAEPGDTAKRAGAAIERGAKAAEKGVRRGAAATERGVKKAGDWVERNAEKAEKGLKKLVQ